MAPQGIHGRILAVRSRNAPGTPFYRGFSDFAMSLRTGLGCSALKPCYDFFFFMLTLVSMPGAIS